MRGRSQRRSGLALGLALTAFASACTSTAESPDYAERGTPNYPGLFTPGSTWGIQASPITGVPADPNAPSAADQNAAAVEEGITSVQGQDRCVGYAPAAGAVGQAGGAMSRGELMIEFMTQPLMQNKTYTPTNVGAVWIEDSANPPNHIKTIDVWADERLHALFVWLKRGCPTLEMDAISGATRPTHDEAHRAIWDGKDLHGNPVPDGMYRLNIEVTETEGDYSQWSQHEFEKGTRSWSQTPADERAHKALQLTYSTTP